MSQKFLLFLLTAAESGMLVAYTSRIDGLLLLADIGDYIDEE